MAEWLKAHIGAREEVNLFESGLVNMRGGSPNSAPQGFESLSIPLKDIKKQKEKNMTENKEEIEILNKLGELLMFFNEKEISIYKVLHLLHLKISSDIIQYNLIYAEDPINRLNKWVKQSCSFYENKFLEHRERQKMRKNEFMELLNNLQKE